MKLRGVSMDLNSLDRFLEAQERMYSVALKEIQNGEKESHWMWYIFPQLRGLGRSQMAYVYGINGIEEAKAYLKHPVLSARLIEICEALLTHKGKDIYDIMGDIDDMKLSKHQQSVACKELETYGIIKIKYHGMPKKRYFKFDPAAFNKLYNDFKLNSNSNEEEIEFFEVCF